MSKMPALLAYTFDSSRAANRDGGEGNAEVGGAVRVESSMLVLARQRDETIMIGDEVEVTVVDIRGDKVRLGLNAPKTIAVHRKEIYDAIRRENRDAAQVRPQDVPNLAGARPPVQMKLVAAEQLDREAHFPFLMAAVEEARAGLKEGG